MRPQALAALLALLAVPAALAAEGFQRPANGDCIALSTGSDVSLFPEQYMMVGDARSQDGFITQARGAGVAPLHLCQVAAAAALPSDIVPIHPRPGALPAALEVL